ncbi:MAG: ATP-binding cassette domain-containing protein, partial [Acutalibacteraceae bacterium]|nr:ATP-binding cassette domain-containing protein [Acutalibacteraceae bacterium]
MISTVNVSLQYGGRELFKGADLKFTDGNCYGLIGANGAGKSTFLKILSGEIEPNKGEVIITPGERMSVLRQDHFAFDEYDVIRTVLMGNPHLCEIMDEKEALYMKEDFSEEDGIKVSELEEEFAEMGGWSAESDAEILLNGLGVTNEFHYAKMSELD